MRSAMWTWVASLIGGRTYGLTVEGKQRIVDHDGCGAPLIRDATLLRESGAPRHGRHQILLRRE